MNELAQELRMTQPRASKHLRVLREVGLVRVTQGGESNVSMRSTREGSTDP